MNAEEAPVPGSGSPAGNVQVDAGCNRQEAMPGDTWYSLSHSGRTAAPSATPDNPRRRKPRGFSFARPLPGGPDGKKPLRHGPVGGRQGLSLPARAGGKRELSAPG